jgi:hypothetical protein
MNKTAAVIRAICLLAFVGPMGNITARAEQSQPLDKKDVPPAVVSAFEKAYPDARVTAIEKITAEDQTQYSFEIALDKGEKDVIYQPDGALYAIAEDMASEALPTVVADAVHKAYPTGQIDEADKITRGAETEYEVVVEVAEGETETEFEVMVASTGKIIDRWQVGDDEEDDDDEDGEDEEDEDAANFDDEEDDE